MKFSKAPVTILVFFSAVIILTSCSKKIIPEKPELARTNFNLDSLPESDINIPVQIALKPIYAIAEKNVDTLFTSPNWPNDWVQDECDVRYKYSFRRGPLQMSAAGTNLSLAFTGFYKIIGSTRVCVNGTVVSPWTPACSCGFDEGERKVNVSFNNSLTITPDLKAKLTIKPGEPKAIDKCTVCFWGQDITKEVVNGLKAQLDTAKRDIEKTFGNYDLRPKLQLLWNELNKAYNLNGMGWLLINPQKIRLNNLYAQNDSLNIFLGLSAKPVVSFEKLQDKVANVPNISDFSKRNGFNIFLDAILNYDSLSNIANSKMKDQRFDVAAGKYIIVKNIELYGVDNANLIVKVDFEGSQKGTFYLTGKPAYDVASKTIEIKDLDFDIRSKNMLLKTAEWLFSKKIINELKKNTKFDLNTYMASAITSMNQQLNKEWVKGISSTGNIDELKIIRFYPLREHLIIRSNCSGSLSVKADVSNFSF